MAGRAPKSASIQRVFGHRKRLEQDLAHITQEMYLRNKELAETNQVLSLLRGIDSLVLESEESLEEICRNIAGLITTTGNYPLVAILAHTPKRSDELTVFGWSCSLIPPKTDISPVLKKIKVTTHFDWFDKDQKGELFQTELMASDELAAVLGCDLEATEDIRKLIPIKSIYAVKLMARQKLVGLLVVGFLNPVSSPNLLNTKLLDRLSDSVGIAIDNKLLFEENIRVLRQLKVTNHKLQALDEAKDEFISMASHQLRTPLTSVKGYLSMVLEGDAGKLTTAQKKLLDQAFVSSQRMVFLIADLLNVSRLKTGKFLIEPKPTNLAEIIEQEVAQLKETAEGRGLTLTYKKPKNFPELLIDETKIRQVVMNFMDNAIYYTPAGGGITVNLTETPESVQFSVTDNGLGVPKNEQPHLFTKFYRAVNARKARPDGTGLGLFMAKKVVVAQGGAIIFKSQEGKGSTFGFSFSKSKLAATNPVVTGPSVK
jgi:signal transduction histidine kinase